MNPDFLYLFLSGIVVAAASGLIGSFLILRRMTLMSDALSHVALPGIAVGLILNFQPVLGGLLFLFFGILIIWRIENKTRLAVESVTGVIFVTALALGALLIPQQDLLETFFGSVEKLTSFQIIFQTLLAAIIIVVTLRYLKPLVLSSMAPDLAAASKIKTGKMELHLLALIASTITIGIGFVGVLLMSALSIIPAATARNLSTKFKTFLVLSAGLAVLTLAAGLIVSQIWPINTGIASVLVSALLFVLSLFKR